jgi:AcrR family transcriptional regulator
MRTSVTPLFSVRQSRERELVVATRSLFDSRGMQHAPVEEIARSVGIARGLIYRQFSSKEELFVLTVTDYLDELHGELETAVARSRKPANRLRRCAEAFAEFGLRYPAFLDCALSLMQRPADELQAMVSESVWWRLGQGMARCIDVLAGILRDGVAAGDFATEDPDFVANVLWTQGLGVLHLARLGVGVRRHPAGVPVLFEVDRKRLVESCVATALALARADVG